MANGNLFWGRWKKDKDMVRSLWGLPLAELPGLLQSLTCCRLSKCEEKEQEIGGLPEPMGRSRSLRVGQFGSSSFSDPRYWPFLRGLQPQSQSGSPLSS